LERLVELTYENPRRIFGLPVQTDTRVEVELNARHTVEADKLQTKCGWTPFEGMPVQGTVREVVLRGQTVYRDGTVIVMPGYGRFVIPVSPGAKHDSAVPFPHH
jgi:dihydroorotase-like cyclic amidohydrolase